jgi:hypothetical protein
MFKTLGSYLLASSLVLLCGVDAAYAQRQAPAFRPGRDTAPQTINFTFGGFAPFGLGSRVDNDALIFDCDSNPGSDQCNFLDFNIGQGVTFGAEYLYTIGQRIEIGGGVSSIHKKIDSNYANFVASDETEIEQKLTINQVPLEFTVRFLPLGQSSHFQPYFGGGIGVFIWRYSENGDWVDFTLDNNPIFNQEFKDSGTTIGGTILGGVRYAGEAFTVGGEFRYHRATADLSTSEFPPLDPTVDNLKIDLGGWRYQVTFGVRFD